MGISHQNVLPMPTFHTPPPSIMQHNGVFTLLYHGFVDFAFAFQTAKNLQWASQ
jgi:hypothetical protein